MYTLTSSRGWKTDEQRNKSACLGDSLKIKDNREKKGGTFTRKKKKIERAQISSLT